MKKINKLISILIAVAMLLSMTPISAFAASVVASGKFGASGSNLTWSLDSDGVLTVSGSGAMEDFANGASMPWYSKRANIKTVVIESGVTNIGKNAFTGFTAISTATISDTVTSIGDKAFSNSSLANFEFSDGGNLKTIGTSAFNSTRIKSMVIPDGVTTLGSYIFGYGPIKSVTIPASVTSVGNYVFEETSSLSEVIFLGNKEPETIGNTVFLGCSSLAYVSVPADYEGDDFSNLKVAKAVSSVAEVNGQGFATLADAISAAQSINGAELKLLSHISIDSGITIESGNFTIDLNGKELFSNGYFLLRIDGADVIIVDSAGGGIFNATNDQGNIVLEVLSGSANISGGTFNSASYPATVRGGTLKLTGKDFVLNGNWRIGWYGGNIDLSACTADEVLIQACADGLQASAITLPDGWGLFKNNGTPCTDFVKNDIYVAKAGFKVTASVNPAEGGTVEGAGTYSSGATVNLSATAANGYRFINWIENGEEVSTSAVYTFTASKNRELTANFEIVPHTHSFTYSAGGGRIVATCVAGDCPLENGIGGMLTISAPADLYVDGETAKEAVIDNQLVEAVDYTVTYSTADGTAPKTAGTYTASVTLGGATATVEFTLLNYAAKVTDKDGNELEGSPYKTFAAAVRAAEKSEGSTVTLLDDIALSSTQYVYSSTFTLDLNGKTLLNETAAAISIESDADVTIKDSDEGGIIESKTQSSETIYNYGTLTVESGIIKGDGGIDNRGTLNFKNGKIEADKSHAIINFGTAYIYNGILESSGNNAIRSNPDATIYVYGGEFSGSAGIVNHGTAFIEGGEFTGKSYAALNLLGGTVEVTGGSFTGTDFASGYYSGTPYGEYTVYCNEGATLTLKSGEFPNGFVVANTSANAILAEDYYYKDVDGKLIDVADDANIINGYVKVSKGADLSDAVITVDKTEFVYNGQHQAPAVTVTIGGKTLKENVDYAVNARRWENGVPVQWFYYVDAGVYTSVIDGLGDYTGKVEKEFVIKPATVDIIWEGDEFYYTGNPHKVAAKYIDIDGNESNEFELINYVNTNVGVYTATAIFADNNYSATEAAINHTYEIKWYDGAPDAEIGGIKGENGWYIRPVIVTAPDGYVIDTLVDGTYGNTITFVENEENAVFYMKEIATGYIAKVELGEIKVDLNDPTAEITVGENKWNSFLNTITFGKFFKQTQSVTIAASDQTSGVAKIEYFIATEEITDFENIEWIEYTGKFDIEPNSKNIIYAKATDQAGRTIIINSDGIVVYSVSQVTTADTLIYTLTTIEDVEYSVDFKGNTVDYVRINNDELSTDEYEATEKSVIIKGEYIENLAADAVYEIVIGIDPMGENFAVGDAPAEMKAYLAVEKITGSVMITNDISKVYDGTPVEAPQYETIGTGEVTIKYTSAIGEPQYTDVVPTQAGTYFVLVEIAETNKSTYDFGVAEFTIAKADSAITAAPTPNTLTYNGEAHNLISAGEAMYGTMVYSLDGTKYSETIPQGTDAGDYTVYYKVAGDSNHNDTVAETVTVTIDKKLVSVSATVPDRIYGEHYEVDTSKVVVTFDGIVEGDDVGYVVTDATYYMHTVTDNAPVQVVYNVNGADAGNYQFPEFGDRIAPNFGVEATGRVLPRDIANAEITLGDALVYNGTEQTQTVAAVTVGGLEVTYTVSGNKATNVGVYELTITGNGNFAGETTALYEIAPDTTGVDVLNVDNVKSSDKEAIEAVAQQIENAVTDLADDEKKAEYKAITDKCDELLSKINDTVNEIERIDEAVNGYDKETVTSADIPELGKLIDDIKALTDGDNLTEDERATLEEADKAIDELLEKLAEVAEEIKKVDEAVKSYDEETVKSTDSEDLAQLKDDVQALIDSGNTTENEKTALGEIIEKVEGLEDKIEEIETQLERIAGIENVYNPETVTSDDKAAIKEAITEIEAVNPDNLTDEQKEEYKEIKIGLEALLDKISAATLQVDAVGEVLAAFDADRVTIFWEDDIEAVKARIDELLADENMGEAEKAKLEEYKAECDKLIEIIHTPVEYFSLRLFYLIWDLILWIWNSVVNAFSGLFGIRAIA
ncbi:MAG: leucine-rich repeat protein [Clostridia bacterium]|nr:leucine-rich repeat protein [Clostridia bacterium]